MRLGTDVPGLNELKDVPPRRRNLESVADGTARVRIRRTVSREIALTLLAWPPLS